jgi:hypothetical protein
LTIKSTSHTTERYSSKRFSYTCVLYARQIFNCQRSRLHQQSATVAQTSRSAYLANC